MFEAFVLLGLLAAGGGIAYALWYLAKGVERRADEMEEHAQAAAAKTEPPRIREAVGPDGLVYLCAHDFVPPGAPRNLTNVRRRAYAPLTGDELEPRRVAEQILYAVLVTHLEAGDVRLQISESAPTFMPPFPHKRWTMTVVRERRLAGSPTAEALDCAFDLVEHRKLKKAWEPAEGLPLDELVEDMLKVMRQEMSFWDRAGVYADIRQYLEAALIDQGYLIAPQKETLLERLRHIRPSVNEAARPHLTEASRRLADRLSDFRRKHGSAAALASDSVPGGRSKEIDEQIIEAEPPFDDLPHHDCLKASIYEALLAIRQLEPSEDVGV